VESFWGSSQQMPNIRLDEVTRLAEELSPEDQLRLVERLTRKLQQTSTGGEGVMAEKQRVPQDLYGIWRDRFPPDLDIDGILCEIRHEWESEWPEVFRA
jgi:hypothetical protein